MIESGKRATWGRIGGLRAHGLHGPEIMLAPARAGFLDRFRREADPAGILDPVERDRRAERLRRSHMLSLAAKSAAARQRKKKAGPDRDSGPAMSEVASSDGRPSTS